MHPFDARVVVRHPEAPDTVTLELEARPPAPPLAGQFLTIDPSRIPALAGRLSDRLASTGRIERPRAYSVGSDPAVPTLRITIRREPDLPVPALLSWWLVERAEVGTVIPCLGFQGLYVLPSDLPPGATVIHVCAGTGIVPNAAILADALRRRPDLQHRLVDVNRSWETVVYRNELSELASRSGGRLEIVHHLTRDTQAPAGVMVVSGRPDGDVFKQIASESDPATTWWMVCGPSVSEHERRAARLAGTTPTPRFVEQVRAWLREMGVDRSHILSEGW